MWICLKIRIKTDGGPIEWATLSDDKCSVIIVFKHKEGRCQSDAQSVQLIMFCVFENKIK